MGSCYTGTWNCCGRAGSNLKKNRLTKKEAEIIKKASKAELKKVSSKTR
ncbi:hypothetical protein JD969_13540 [Planctomycetota bacterium]|nr:hypothetical protein JD969_13540 [Planctomycetota bacterium]